MTGSGNLRIDVRISSIHRRGVFAEINMAAGTKIIEYLGRKITKEESQRLSIEEYNLHLQDPENNAATYIFILNDEWDLDGNIPGNDAKFINHSCNPNCRFEYEDDHIWIVAKRNIDKGEELTYNYGFDIDEDDPEEFQKHPCQCGAPNCVGFILAEEYWPLINKYVKDARTKQLKLVVNNAIK